MSKTKVGERLPYLLSKLKAPRVLERLEQTAALAGLSDSLCRQGLTWVVSAAREFPSGGPAGKEGRFA